MARTVAILVALATCALLVLAVVCNFITAMLADERVKVSRDVLAVVADYFPNSARLHARLAEAEVIEHERDVVRAEFHSLRAVTLSPYNFSFRLLLASIKELRGDRAAAEESLRAALALAPNNADVHWRLANLLVSQGKLTQSLDEFRVATATNSSLLLAALDLIWRASGGNLEAMEAVTGGEPKAKLALVQLLVKQSQVAEAARIFSHLDHSTRLASPESAAFLNALIAAGHLELARDLWVNLISGSNSVGPLIWNGGFESGVLRDFSQFDWTIERSDYAGIAIDTGMAHTGARSLRIDFAGRDTTRLDSEIKQLVIVRPGAHYRLECYAKAGRLVTPEGPRVVVTSGISSAWIAASAPVIAGSSDWQRLTVDFVAPGGTAGGVSAIFVTIKRTPKFSYDDPTRGTVWFDDFTMIEWEGDK